MSVLSENIRYLRAQLKYSQQKIADDLLITRGRYAKYEDGDTEPPIEILLKISRYFRVSIDLLVSVELRRFPMDELLRLPDNRILLPITIDGSGENKIEIIPYKASMGYLNGYADPEYIETLQHLSLPFLRNGNYRAFPVEGDSMPPFKDGTFIIGRYIENIQEMKIGKTYLLVTRTGFVYKRLAEMDEKSIRVVSDNSFYEPYRIPFQDLLEIWEYEYSLMKDYDFSDGNTQEIKGMFLSLKDDIKRVESHLKL
ncbi:XRE family transcriptional regulator [Chryseobacterium profundimaris]|uniref:DNA-binding transcriptional regulator, XRE-family HTH domain n=1 Tax=Chryseobacterium profundimaris TaxID=1387275 RepID=A0ABY1NWH1_9FLAO|nr:LexA family transcriptional regulator [Chryseobacterium profundimaris]SMP20263.1 DNA-binding transcriptional regulator, XRE-family HTH domain [Chryseobacterium profundimaris]